MSATLTWYNSDLGVKTGITSANMVDDIVTLVNSFSGDANYSWEIADSNNGASPRYVVLKPKSGAVGRILLVVWTSSPAGNNAAILNGSSLPTDVLFCTYFPAGNVDTPSNLTVSSGTIMGDDTGALYVSPYTDVSTMYGSLRQPFYFDSAEAMFFGFCNPASGTFYGFGAGNLVVDLNDNAYPANIGFGNQGMNTMVSSDPMGWNPPGTVLSPSALQGRTRTNYGAANRTYFNAYTAGSWQGSSSASQDMLADAANSKADFVPIPLIGQTKAEGFVLKLRQIARGPYHSGVAFPAYSTTGPVVAARKFQGASSGGDGLWFTNFKL